MFAAGPGSPRPASCPAAARPSPPSSAGSLAALRGDADHLADHAARDVARVLRRAGRRARAREARRAARARSRGCAAPSRATRLAVNASETSARSRIVARRVEALDRGHEARRADQRPLGRERRRVGRDRVHVGEARKRPEPGGAPRERLAVAQLAVDVVEPRLEVRPRPIPAAGCGLRGRAHHACTSGSTLPANSLRLFSASSKLMPP